MIQLLFIVFDDVSWWSLISKYVWWPLELHHSYSLKSKPTFCFFESVVSMHDESGHVQGKDLRPNDHILSIQIYVSGVLVSNLKIRLKLGICVGTYAKRFLIDSRTHHPAEWPLFHEIVLDTVAIVLHVKGRLIAANKSNNRVGRYITRIHAVLSSVPLSCFVSGYTC